MNVQDIKVKEETMNVNERIAQLESDYEKLLKNFKKQQVELENERLKFSEASKIINTKQNLLKESDQQIDQLKTKIIEAELKIKELEIVSGFGNIAKLENENKMFSIQLGVEKYKNDDVSKQLARREKEAEEKDFNLGKLTAMVEQMKIENEKLKEDGKEKGNKLAPKVIDEDSKQKESCSNYRIAVEKIIDEIESEEGDWRTVMEVITKADDVVARKQKNITKISQARKNLRDDGEGYEQSINTFKKAKDVWEKELISNQIHLLSKNLTPEINKEFARKLAKSIRKNNEAKQSLSKQNYNPKGNSKKLFNSSGKRTKY
ncbi:hypothetical protein ACTA71_005243 [Dictyostelium dimigraforme]